MRRARPGAALAAVSALVIATPAVAKVVTTTKLHDARYCEIFEVRGTLPDASATVYNTIGLDTCPPALWHFDPVALAKENGDTLVVLNGPRHFLMDAATADVGAQKTFHGLKTTRVASIPLRTAADLAQTPYSDRTIRRTNTWTWNRGRTVFELVAPGGDTYVMQSYALIEDPALTLARLPKLASRLSLLPPGWSYRTRVLKKALTLDAKGSTTIIQDDLQDTYQLATSPRRPTKATTHTLHVQGITKSVPPVNLAGTIDLHGSFTAGVFHADVRLLFPTGSIIASATMTPTVTGNEVDFTGTTVITGGTGAYRAIKSGPLKTHDHNTLDGQNGTISLDGSATY